MQKRQAMLSYTLVAAFLLTSLVLANPFTPLVIFAAIYGLVLPGSAPTMDASYSCNSLHMHCGHCRVLP